MSISPVLIPPLVFVTTVLFVLALFPPRPRTLPERLAPYGARAALLGPERQLTRSLVERVFLPALSAVLGRLGALAPTRLRDQAQAELERAGQPMRISTLLALRAVCMFGMPGVYVLVVSGAQATLSLMALIIPLLLFWAGQRLPVLWLRSRVRARERQIERAMPHAMDLLTVSMEAGLAFDAALSKVVEKTHGPLRDELARVLHEMTLGKSRREALREVARRVAIQDLGSFVAAVIQADQMGLGLGPVMRGLADELRTRRRQRAEEQAMKAPVKMLFPLILFIFPAMMLVVVGPGVLILFTRVFGSDGGF